MRTMLLVLGSAILAAAAAAAWTPAERTVAGEVVELSGYLTLGSRGEAGRAQASLAKGGTPALLTDEGQVILILSDPKGSGRADLSPYVGFRVSVRGSAYSKGGVTGLVVASVEPVPAAAALEAAPDGRGDPLQP